MFHIKYNDFGITVENYCNACKRMFDVYTFLPTGGGSIDLEEALSKSYIHTICRDCAMESR